MTEAVLSIGSNMGDRLAALQCAVAEHRPWIRAISPVFESDPWGPVRQDPFLNAVLVVEDAQATPRDWLNRARAAEAAGGRTRELRWGPRTLDVDVVTVDEFASADPELTLPHPRAAERAFVLIPWLAVRPGARWSGTPVADLIAALPAEELAGVRLRADLELT